MIEIITMKQVRASNLDVIITDRDISPLNADAIFRDLERPQLSCFFCNKGPSSRRYIHAYFILEQSTHLVDLCCTRCVNSLDRLVAEGESE